MELCRLIVSQVKPFYEAEEKFKSHVSFVAWFASFITLYHAQNDYLHLLKVLTTYFCKSFKSGPGSASGKWTVTDTIRREVKDLVQRIMSQCTVYTPELDVRLGLKTE